MLADILNVDWDQVRLKRAASALVAMLLAVVFAGIVGDVVLSGLMATLFVTAASSDGTMAQRFPGMVRFTFFGAVVGGLAYWSVDNGFGVAVVLGGATYLGTLAAAAGPAAAKSGMFLMLWALFALMLGSADTEPWEVSVAFLVGGAIAIAVTALRLRAVPEDEAGAIDEPTEEDSVAGERFTSLRQLGPAVSSPIGWFALLRTTAVVLAVLLGYWWFPSYPLWVAISVVVVVKPSASQSVSAAVQRTIGTALGVGIAVGLAQVLPTSDTAVVIAFLISGFLMIAFNNANYILFATFLTAMLVFGQRLAQADAFEAGWERLLATAVGALIAFITVMIAMKLFPASPPASSDPAAGS